VLSGRLVVGLVVISRRSLDRGRKGMPKLTKQNLTHAIDTVNEKLDHAGAITVGILGMPRNSAFSLVLVLMRKCWARTSLWRKKMPLTASLL
jgi:hypothetical protein